MGATTGYQLHSISSTKSSSQTVVTALAELVEAAQPSAEVVKSSCAHHYVLDGSTLPM